MELTIPSFNGNQEILQQKNMIKTFLSFEATLFVDVDL